MLAMFATIAGVIVYRLVISSVRNPIDQLIAIASGAALAVGVILVTRCTGSVASKIVLTAVVCLVSLLFARDFVSFLLGLALGLTLPTTGVMVVNALLRVAGIEEVRRRGNGRS